MANINFTYNYPYCGFGDNARFRGDWSDSRYKLNGCYTYPFIFNNTVPRVSHIVMDIEIENTGSGTIYNRSWDFMVRRSSGSWVDIITFTLPSDGKYTIDCDIPNYDITMLACLPTSNPGSSREWSNWYDIQSLTITETVPEGELLTNEFIYGVFTNYYGLEQQVNEVFANIDGTLKRATSVLINVDDILVPLETVYSSHITSSAETMKVYRFTVPQDGKYQIRVKRLSGDHEIRLYDSNFAPIDDDYFYSNSFDFTAGAVFYITATHYYSAGESESYLQIYKEA